jgi:hypothetical protein
LKATIAGLFGASAACPIIKRLNQKAAAIRAAAAG